MESLKFLLLFVTATTFASSERNWLTLLAPIIAECATKNSLKADELGTAIFQDEFPEDQLCGIKCVYVELKLLKNDGTFDYDEFVKQVKEVVEEVKDLDIIKECTTKIGKLITCEDMKKLNECFKEAGSETNS